MPSNIDVLTWFAFLLRHGVKPYQQTFLDVNVVAGLINVKRLGRPRKGTIAYYVNSSNRVYGEFLAEFVLLLNAEANGAVVDRVTRIYKHFFFDEIQDISARDFEVVHLFLDSPMAVTLSGDPRQATFSTTTSRTNRKWSGFGIADWLEGLDAERVLRLEEHNFSRRCVQDICDFGDKIFPQLTPTSSLNTTSTEHDGVFLVRTTDVDAYVNAFAPQLLVWQKTSNTYGLSARNMGEVKGLTFPRVLIGPTVPMEEYLRKGLVLVPGARSKLYVAATRARQSATIVLDKPGNCQLPYWSP
ncbi:hypothetical protein [Cryobacterium ruanii]|uniref:hypothetical protein n=1 Tax=Cryobacterium ruanii TaxID=1259197 RepID=UPI003BB0487B